MAVALVTDARPTLTPSVESLDVSEDFRVRYLLRIQRELQEHSPIGRPPGPTRHGTLTAYAHHGCRCSVCVSVMRVYQRNKLRVWRARQQASADPVNVQQRGKAAVGSYLSRWMT